MAESRSKSIERLQYSAGQLLDVDDFKNEQEYHREMRLRHNRSVHSWGIVEGLTVTVANNKITIAPGTALDNKGQELCLLGQMTLDLETGLKSTVLYVTATFKFDGGKEVTKNSQHLYWTRTIEQVEIAVTATKPPADGSVIVLAILEADEAGTITVKLSDRSRSVGSRIDPAADLTVGRLSLQGPNAKRGALFLAGLGDFNHALYNNNSNIDGEGVWDGAKWNVYLGLNIRCGSGKNKQSALFIDGSRNVGIGTTDPKSTLSVAGRLTIGATYAKTNTAPDNGLLVESRVRIGTGNRVSDAKLAIGGDSAETGFGQGTHWLQLRNDKIDTKDAKWGIAWDGGDPVNTPTAFILANFDEANTYPTSLTFGTRNRVGNTAERMRVTSDGNVGIGTISPGARLEVAGTLTATQNNEALVGLKITPTFQDSGKAGVKHYGLIVAEGNVGIGTTAPVSKLHIDKGRVDITTSDVTGGGQNRFDGLLRWNADAAYRRGQLVLSSSYSDLVIASSHDNNIHGSTLTFATYNPTDVTDYRKWVINQGNWGTRKQFLDFGYADEKGRANPHDNIKNTDTVLTLDGVNKRVGIGTGTPAATLQIGETIAHCNNYDFSASKLLVRAKDHNGGTTPAATQSVLALVREGVGSQAYGNMVDFRLGRWEHATSYQSRTQLDIYLTGDSFSPKHVMSLRANGNVGIGTTSPGAKLEVAGEIKFSGEGLKTDALGKITPFYLRGTGLNNNGARTLIIGSTTVYDTATASGRGLTLTIINKSDHKGVSTNTYDTYGGGAVASDKLATALNGITKTHIGILTSVDAWEWQMTPSLRNAFYRVGLYKAAATPADHQDQGGRRPYAAIFEASSSSKENTSKAVEVLYSNDKDAPFAEICGWLIDGSFIATGVSGGGPILEQLDVIKTNNLGDWGTNKNHPIVKYFIEKLRGKPTGTLMRAFSDHTGWPGFYFEAWVSSSSEIKVTNNRHTGEPAIFSI